jgi:hypothetical protein
MDIDLKRGLALTVATLAGFLIMWLTPPTSWLGRAISALQGDPGDDRGE